MAKWLISISILSCGLLALPLVSCGSSMSMKTYFDNTITEADCLAQKGEWKRERKDLIHKYTGNDLCYWKEGK